MKNTLRLGLVFQDEFLDEGRTPVVGIVVSICAVTYPCLLEFPIRGLPLLEEGDEVVPVEIAGIGHGVERWTARD